MNQPLKNLKLRFIFLIDYFDPSVLLLALMLIYWAPLEAPTTIILDSLKKILTLDSWNYDQNDYWMNQTTPNELEPRSLDWIKKVLITTPELKLYAQDGICCCSECDDQIEHYSWSKELYGYHYPEFDRTVLSVWCLRAFYNGSKAAWLEFIAHQPADNALKWESFQKIHNELTQFVEDYQGLDRDQVLKTMEAYLILTDIGKTPFAQKKCREKNISINDYKDFFQHSLHHFPELYPTLKTLSYPSLQLLLHSAFPIQMSKIRHLEGHSGMFSRLVESKLILNDVDAFNFFYLCDLCDTAAFLGQKNVDGSSFLTESMYQANCLAKQACENTANYNELEVYKEYLEQRGKIFNFDSTQKIDRVLTIIAAMLRLYQPDHGLMLKQAFANLDLYQQVLIISQFDLRFNDCLRCTPSYIPAVLNNIFHNKAFSQAPIQERLEKTFVIGLPFIAKVLKEYRTTLPLATTRIDPNDCHLKANFSLNFCFVAKQVISNPYVLNHAKYMIDNQNCVHID
jgi:hypothetical protein